MPSFVTVVYSIRRFDFSLYFRIRLFLMRAGRMSHIFCPREISIYFLLFRIKILLNGFYVWCKTRYWDRQNHAIIDTQGIQDFEEEVLVSFLKVGHSLIYSYLSFKTSGIFFVFDRAKYFVYILKQFDYWQLFLVLCWSISLCYKHKYPFLISFYTV